MNNLSVDQVEFVTILENECIAMMNYAFANGLIVPPHVAGTLEKFKTEQKKQDDNPDDDNKNEISNGGKAEALTKIHNVLSELVKPAKPQTILLIANEAKKKSPFFFLGKVPLIRQMMFVAVFSLISLITISLSSDICAEHVVKSMFELNGKRLLMVQAILLSASAIGASFIILHRANSYITAGTYDPKYESSYWVRLIVGLISGVILTQLIPLDLGQLSEGMATSATVSKKSVASKAMLRVTLALLGGFSANLVYNILNRLVETLQALITPDPGPDPLIQEKLLNDKYNDKLSRYQNKIIVDAAQVHKALMEDGNQNQNKINEILGDFVKNISDKKLS